MAPDIASWVVPFIVIGIIMSAIFGLVPLFYPQFNQVFGFKVTDIFLYGQAGAATLGYACHGHLRATISQLARDTQPRRHGGYLQRPGFSRQPRNHRPW